MLKYLIRYLQQLYTLKDIKSRGLKKFMNHYQRIKDLREDHDLNQRQLAQLLQTTQHQISKYETGKQMMGIDKYIKLAKHFNVSLDYLAGLINFPEKLER